MMRKLFVLVLMLILSSGFSKAQDTAIVNIISEINADNIWNSIQALQDFGTRCSTSPTRRSVALWIKQKFVDAGYLNAAIDSFYQTEYYPYNTWQYNVVASLIGYLNPDACNVVGAHYDSVNNDSVGPNVSAPGADDNASGIAAVLEIARVLKMKNYIPNTTIIFVAFASEEQSGGGSSHFADQTISTGQKIQMMINMDMISYFPAAIDWNARLQDYPGFESFAELAKSVCSAYTSLSYTIELDSQHGTDSDIIYQKGLPAFNFIEKELNPHYHSNGDTIGYCNIPYCAEITKAACAMLLQANNHPPVRKLHSYGRHNHITVTWRKNEEQQVRGYNLYKTRTLDSSWIKVNPKVIIDTFYVDNDIINGVYYYYRAATVDSLFSESVYSNIDSTIGLSLNPGILLVDDSDGGLLNPPDSAIDNFYHRLLTGYNYTDYDANAVGTIDLSVIGNYSSVVWHVERMNAGSLFYSLKGGLTDYLESGGNLFINMERLSFGIEHNSSYPNTFSKGDFIHDYLKIDSVKKKVAARFFGAIPYVSEFSPIFIDTLKMPDANMNYIGNVEAIYPNIEATAIYKYYSQYDSTTSQGQMVGMPVGVTFTGTGYKVISVSFPLYYMNYEEAKSFVDKVLHNTFAEPAEIQDDEAGNIQNIILFQNSPNPCNTSTVIKYFLPEKTNVTLEVYSIYGNKIAILVNETQSKGFYSITWNTSNLNPGTYFYCLKSIDNYLAKKLIITK